MLLNFVGQALSATTAPAPSLPATSGATTGVFLKSGVATPAPITAAATPSILGQIALFLPVKVSVDVDVKKIVLSCFKDAFIVMHIICPFEKIVKDLPNTLFIQLQVLQIPLTSSCMCIYHW